MLLRFWRANPLVYYREVQRHWGPTESLEPHGKKTNQKGPKYSRKALVEETMGPWSGGKGPIGSQLGKGPIKSGMLTRYPKVAGYLRYSNNCF